MTERQILEGGISLEWRHIKLVRMIAVLMVYAVGIGMVIWRVIFSLEEIPFWEVWGTCTILSDVVSLYSFFLAHIYGYRRQQDWTLDDKITVVLCALVIVIVLPYRYFHPIESWHWRLWVISYFVMTLGLLALLTRRTVDDVTGWIDTLSANRDDYVSFREYIALLSQSAQAQSESEPDEDDTGD